MSEETRLVVGQVLAGRYWLQEHLGRGQTGDVFRARHTKVPREFAIKVLHPELVTDQAVCARFEREAEVAGRLRHRNVISVIDIGETARSRYIVMELAHGPNLAQLIAQGPFDAARTIRLAMQICDGLHHAHEHDLPRRGRIAVWATVAVLLLFAGVAGLAMSSRAPADPITVELAESAPTKISAEVARDEVPAVVPTAVAVVAARTRGEPRRTDLAPAPEPAAIAAPIVLAQPIVEARPVAADPVIQLYASLGRTLKQISDRRDLSADDLWQRYRRVRIQEAIATSATRADAMNVLMAIEREIETRYRSPVL